MDLRDIQQVQQLQYTRILVLYTRNTTTVNAVIDLWPKGNQSPSAQLDIDCSFGTESRESILYMRHGAQGVSCFTGRVGGAGASSLYCVIVFVSVRGTVSFRGSAAFFADNHEQCFSSLVAASSSSRLREHIHPSLFLCSPLPRPCCRAAMALNAMLLRNFKPMLPLLPRAAARACLMSSARTQAQTFQVGQGGRLVVDMAKTAAVVKVTTQWMDSCSLTISRLPAGADPDCYDVEGLGAMEQVVPFRSLESAGLTLQADETLSRLTLAHGQDRTGADWKGAYLIEAAVPELFSLDVSISHGNVSVSNKLKGDCQIQLDSGDIGVGTVRGESIRLSTGRGHVKVDELEGNVDIKATADVSHHGNSTPAVLQSCTLKKGE